MNLLTTVHDGECECVYATIYDDGFNEMGKQVIFGSLMGLVWAMHA